MLEAFAGCDCMITAQDSVNSKHSMQYFLSCCAQALYVARRQVQVASLTCVSCRAAGSGAVAQGPIGSMRTAASGALLSGSPAVLRPVAPDLVANATSAAVSAAASAIDLTCLEIDVVAVGMGLRFVEIETGSQEVCTCSAINGLMSCVKYNICQVE